jgi:hypothetical protein
LTGYFKVLFFEANKKRLTMEPCYIKDYVRRSWIIGPIRFFRKIIREIPYYGNGYWCPVCEKSSRKFATLPFEGMCIHCDSLARHRFAWVYLEQKTDLIYGKKNKVLHIAPEKGFEDKLKKLLGVRYISADLRSPKVMVKMDITNIQYPDQSFDVIFCSHVLQQVQDDRKAMSELFRVLKNDGWAILLVPITANITFEDPTITEPYERKERFGSEDHVRRYGLDYIDRLIIAGFKVTVTEVSDLFNETEIRIMGLNKGAGEIYYCTKQ